MMPISLDDLKKMLHQHPGTSKGGAAGNGTAGAGGRGGGAGGGGRRRNGPPAPAALPSSFSAEEQERYRQSGSWTSGDDGTGTSNGLLMQSRPSLDEPRLSSSSYTSTEEYDSSDLRTNPSDESNNHFYRRNLKGRGGGGGSGSNYPKTQYPKHYYRTQPQQPQPQQQYPVQRRLVQQQPSQHVQGAAGRPPVHPLIPPGATAGGGGTTYWSHAARPPQSQSQSPPRPVPHSEDDLVDVEAGNFYYPNSGAERRHQNQRHQQQPQRSSWDSDPDFSKKEIERIRNKTQKLRRDHMKQSNNGGGSSDSDNNNHSSNVDDVNNPFREVGRGAFRDAVVSDAHEGGAGSGSGDDTGFEIDADRLQVFESRSAENRKSTISGAAAAPATATPATSAVPRSVANLVQSPSHDTTLTPSVGSSARQQKDQVQQQQKRERQGGGGPTRNYPFRSLSAGGESGSSSGNSKSARVVSPEQQGISQTAQKAQRALMESFHRQPNSNGRQRKNRGQQQQQAVMVVDDLPHNPSSQDSSDANNKPALNLSGRTEDTHNTSGENTIGTSGTTATGSSSGQQQYELHDLCGEATSEDDVAWRNALHALSVQPNLAQVVDGNLWTPLHVACLSSPPHPPPCYLVRALLYVYPYAAHMYDVGGRTPLHLVAACSGDEETMKLLIDENPNAIHSRDARGWTPIQLLLKNHRVQITMERVQLLLGMGIMYSGESEETKHETASSPNVLFRRGQHLQLGLDGLEAWRNKQPPVTKLHKNYSSSSNSSRLHRELDYEAYFETYPPDIQMALRRLNQWKRLERKQHVHEQKEVDEIGGVHAGSGSSDGEQGVVGDNTGAILNWNAAAAPLDESTTPAAAIPCPKNGQLPIHMLVKRAIVDRSPLEEGNNDGGASFSFGGSGDYDDGESDGYDHAERMTDEGLEADDILKDLHDEEVGSSGGRLSKKASSTQTDDSSSSSQNNKPEGIPSVQYPYDVLRLMVACYPEGLICRDANGFTPLLLVLADDKILPSLDVIELLLGKRSAAIGGYYDNLPSWTQDIPLHQLSSSLMGPHHQRINPAMIPLPESLQLPLHLACEELIGDPLLIVTISESYPGAKLVQDGYGRTPLHVALSNYRRIAVSPQVMATLFHERVVHICDDRGRTPFDLLLASAQSLPPREPRSWNAFTDSVESSSPSYVRSSKTAAGADVSNVYQRFIHASILGSDPPTKKAEVHNFLMRLRLLPPWLRRYACSNTQVQELLVEDMAKPCKCAYVLFDGIVLVALIVVFRIQMEDFVLARDEGVSLSSWYTFAVYATATLHLVINVAVGLHAAAVGAFQRLVLCNAWMWIDSAAILMSISTSVLLYGDTSDETLYALGTASTGFLWLSLLGYLTTWSCGVSVFVGGLTNIACYLLWPLVIFGCLAVAFAQMFYTLLQVDCSGSIAVTTVCTVRDAYRVVYMMLLRQPLTDVEGQQTMSFAAILLIALFCLFLIFFLVGLLVTVLVAASNLDFDTIAVGSFWEPKLASYFAINEDIVGLSREESSTRKGISCCISFSAKLEETWNLLTVSLFGGDSRKRMHWYTGATASSSGARAWALRAAAIIVLPTWIVLGIFSFGLLWPPQIRRLLFQPMGYSAASSRKAMSSTENAATQVSQMRNDISELKILSVERSGTLEREFRELKDALHSAMKEA